jgi:peroxiredoxin Q/BCP
MSKKTRTKSSKTSAGTTAGPVAGKTPRSRSMASAKTPATKTGKAAAKEPGNKPKRASVKESHKAASKSLKSETSPAHRPGLVEGAEAPAFRLPRDGGDTVALADYAGKKLVLFFYPRADTPGCTKEAIDFTRLKSAFAENGTTVLGVSADPLKAQESFRNKHQLSVPLVSDEKHQMLEAYGAWGEKSMYGRKFQGILRTTVLIGADGRIAKIWRNVRVDGHADEVLAAARAL